MMLTNQRKNNMDKNLVLSQEDIQEIVVRLGKEITETIKNDKRIPIIIGVMKGSLNFMMDLLKHVECPVYTDYIQISSYEGVSSTGMIRLLKDVSYDCSNRSVIIVEDIIDSGTSMKYLIKHFENHSPNRIYVCALFDKVNARKDHIQVDFIGKTLVKNDFLIGYGLDYNELGRNIPYVYSARKEDVEELDKVLAKDKE